MKKQTITQYILNEKDMQIIKHCLLYSRHRIVKHNKQSSLPVLKEILGLLKEIDKTK